MSNYRLFYLATSHKFKKKKKQRWWLIILIINIIFNKERILYLTKLKNDTEIQARLHSNDLLELKIHISASHCQWESNRRTSGYQFDWATALHDFEWQTSFLISSKRLTLTSKARVRVHLATTINSIGPLLVNWKKNSNNAHWLRDTQKMKKLYWTIMPIFFFLPVWIIYSTLFKKKRESSRKIFRHSPGKFFF